jgi:endonuclease-3
MSFKALKPLKILEKLALCYPEAASELNFSNDYELVVAVLLSAQTTDKKVNEVTPALFALAPDFETLAARSQGKIEMIIRPLNYYKTKAKHLIQMAKIVTAKHRGSLPRTIEEMIELPGVGRKTASVVLGERGILPTLPVDTHVFRVARRLGLSRGKNVLEVEHDLRALYDPKDWRKLHHLLIFHGRRVCKAQRPLCQECVLAKSCPAFLGLIKMI